MSSADIRSFLRTPAGSAFMEFALNEANLTDKERLALRLCGIRGLTQEEAAEEAGYSVDALQKWWLSGCRQAEKAWSGQLWYEQLKQ